MLSSFLFNTANELWGKKWRMAVLWTLKDGPNRFSEIKRNLPGCSVKMLSEVLQEMEGNQLITRKQYPTIPVKVTYELQETVKPLVDVMISYRYVVMKFFLDNNESYRLTDEVINQLKAELLSKK